MSNSDTADQIANPFDPGYFETDELLKMGFGHIGQNVRVAKNATIIGLRNISIGDNVRIDGQTVIAAHTGTLQVGNFVHIGGGCHIGCAGGIILSDFCGLSQGVRIYTCSDDYSGNSLTNPTVPREFLNVTCKSVRLGRHVIIGSGSVLLPGADVGDGSSVGALSLVSKALGEWGVYFGIPVKKLRTRSRKLLEDETRLLEESSKRASNEIANLVNSTEL